MIDHLLVVFHLQAFDRDAPKVKFLPVTDDPDGRQGEDDLPDPQGLGFMKAVESVPGQQENKNPFPAVPGMVQEVLGVEVDKEKFQASLYPGQPLLRDGPSKKKKM